MLIIINAQKIKLYFKLREFVDMVKRNYLNNYQITDAGPDDKQIKLLNNTQNRRNIDTGPD